MYDEDGALVLRKRNYAAPSLEDVSPLVLFRPKEGDAEADWEPIAQVTLVRTKDGSLEGRGSAYLPMFPSCTFEINRPIPLALGTRDCVGGPEPRIAYGKADEWMEQEERGTIHVSGILQFIHVFKSRRYPISASLVMRNEDGADRVVLEDVTISFNQQALLEEIELVFRPPLKTKKASKNEEDDV
jgi:hypothetical protein